jgi:kynureninase
VEASEFPTDQYIAEGLARFSGAALELLRVDENAGLDALARTGGVLIKQRRELSHRRGA